MSKFGMVKASNNQLDVIVAALRSRGVNVARNQVTAVVNWSTKKNYCAHGKIKGVKGKGGFSIYGHAVYV